MRRLPLATLLALLIAANATAQRAAGILITPYFQGGLAGNTTHTHGDDGTAESITPKRCLEGGVTASGAISQHWSFGAGLGYSSSRFQYNNIPGPPPNGPSAIAEYLHSFQIPLFFTYTTGLRNQFSIYARGGIRFGMFNTDHSATRYAGTPFLDINNYDLQGGTSLSPFGEAGVQVPVAQAVSIEGGIGSQFCWQATRKMHADATTHSYALYAHLGVCIDVAKARSHKAGSTPKTEE